MYIYAYSESAWGGALEEGGVVATAHPKYNGGNKHKLCGGDAGSCKPRFSCAPLPPPIKHQHRRWADNRWAPCIYVWVCVHINLYMSIYANMDIHTYTYICTHIYIYIYKYICIYIYMDRWTYMDTSTYTYLHICINICIYIYIYMHIVKKIT